MDWYPVLTRYRHENLVKTYLEKMEFEVFLPKVESLSKRKDRRKIIEKPLFPGYLFIRTELNPENYLKIIKCKGVVRVLGFRDNNTASVSGTVPEDVIESISRMLQAIYR